MKIVTRWTVREDYDLGGMGLFADGWCDNFNPAQSGRIFAHDVMEHAAADQPVGTLENELQALGAALFTRPNIRDGIVYDLVRLSNDHPTVKPAPRLQPDQWDHISAELGDFPDVFAKYRKEFQSEYDDTESTAWNRTAFTRALRWMLDGWVKTEKLFNCQQFDNFLLFQEIESKFPKNFEDYSTFETVLDTGLHSFSIIETTHDDLP